MTWRSAAAVNVLGWHCAMMLKWRKDARQKNKVIPNGLLLHTHSVTKLQANLTSSANSHAGHS
jgi:hypothetical protein